ncbi:hypothetical protein ABIE32_002253 [Comamonas sp. 4034]
MTSEKPNAPAYYMDEYDNVVSAPRERVPIHGVSLTNSPAALANQRLLLDALNTHHECGLSPWELLEGYRELRSALTWMTQRADEGGYPDGRCMKESRAALAKHKEV